jgi:hypothetical protein
MKSGRLTSLSAPALHSDVRVVRFRYEQGPPPCIRPLLIRPYLGGLETGNINFNIWKPSAGLLGAFLFAGSKFEAA